MNTNILTMQYQWKNSVIMLPIQVEVTFNRFIFIIFTLAIGWKDSNTYGYAVAWVLKKQQQMAHHVKGQEIGFSEMYSLLW